MENAAAGPVRVVVVEDQHLFRDLVCLSLAQSPQIEVVARYGEGASALSEIPGLRPDVAVLDIDLPDGMNGVLLGRRLRRQLPGLGIVLLSNYVEPAFLAAVPDQEISGWSYLLKNSVRDVESLHRVVIGAASGMVVLDPALLSVAPTEGDGSLARLTPRQREILHLIAAGYSNAAIASHLGVAVKTVENQINTLYQELKLERNDTEIQPRVMAVLSYLRWRQWR